MTTDEFILKQRKIFQQIIEKDEPLRIAAQDTLAKQATRIFIEGKNSSGGNIGQYNSTNPLYANPKKTAGAATGNKKVNVAGLLPTKGKNGQHFFKNGKEHLTTYVPSYKALRGRLGKVTSKVNLDFSGDLKSDFSNSKSSTGSASIIKVNTHEYIAGLKRGENVDKVNGLEQKYGNIFSPTAAEKKNFFTIAQKEFQRIIANA
jgi:hypothetical protein